MYITLSNTHLLKGYHIRDYVVDRVVETEHEYRIHLIRSHSSFEEVIMARLRRTSVPDVVETHFPIEVGGNYITVIPLEHIQDIDIFALQLTRIINELSKPI